MAGAQGLLQYLVSVQNISGAIKPAPASLMKVKQALQGVPFQLLQPGMSGVTSIQNLIQSMQQFAKMLGGFTNLANGGTGLTGQLIQQIASGTAGASSLQSIISAVGPGAALGMSLTTFLGSADLATITSAAPQADTLAPSTATSPEVVNT